MTRAPRLALATLVLAFPLAARAAVPPAVALQAAVAADPARTSDAAFVAKAAEVIALDTELTSIALSRASRADVKALARAVRDARAVIAKDLETMAGTRQLTISPVDAAAPRQPTPGGPAAGSPSPGTRLRAQPPAAFDAAFLDALAANNEAAVALFEAESRDGRDDEIKDWAARQLPALREQLTAIRALRPRQGS